MIASIVSLLNTGWNIIALIRDRIPKEVRHKAVELVLAAEADPDLDTGTKRRRWVVKELLSAFPNLKESLLRRALEMAIGAIELHQDQEHERQEPEAPAP